MIDDRCTEMADHTTGQHVQGMSLVEAARQMMLSVSEHYFLSDHERFKSYFALLGMDVKFKQFIFPLEVEIQCRVIEYQKIATGKFKATYVMDFLQNNMLGTQITLQFLVEEKEKLQNKEERLANYTLQIAIEKVQDNLQENLLKIKHS